MKNLQTKGFTNVLLIALVIILSGVLGYVTLLKKSNTIEQNSISTNKVTTQADVEKLIREYFANNYKTISSIDLSQQRFRNVLGRYYYGAQIVAHGGHSGLVYTVVENNKIIKLITNATNLEGIMGNELVAAGFPVNFDDITMMCNNDNCSY